MLLPGKSHGQRSLVGCSPWGRKESDTTKRLHFHFSLSCIGQGKGNPLQCSCLENPRDGGAWWAAAVSGVTQSWTRLKRLSSSSRHSLLHGIFPTQGLNPGLLHCRQILYHLSHQGSSSLPELLSYSRIWRLSSWDWYPSSHMDPTETLL